MTIAVENETTVPAEVSVVSGQPVRRLGRRIVWSCADRRGHWEVVSLGPEGIVWSESGEAADGVVFPVIGEYVRLCPQDREPVEGVWLGYDYGFSSLCLEVAVLTGGRVEVVSFDASAAEGLSAVTCVDFRREPLAEVEPLQVLYQMKRSQIVEASRWAMIVEDAHRWADENDLCHRFDDFMEDHGLPARERDFSLEVTATVRVWLTRTARTLDDAREMVTGRDVLEALDSADIDIDEIESDD